jgi:hypothetical protein
MGDLYAAQIVCVGFRSFPGEGAASCVTTMKIATKTQRHKVTQKVLLKINPWCLSAFVAIIFIVSDECWF